MRPRVACKPARHTSPPGKHHALNHAPVVGDTAYGSWRDGRLTLLDITDRSAPRLTAHHNGSPRFGGGTHSALPLPSRELLLAAHEAVLDDEQAADRWSG